MLGFVAEKARQENLRTFENNAKYNQDVVNTNENMFIVLYFV